jgi:acyl dehydratase
MANVIDGETMLTRRGLLLGGLGIAAASAGRLIPSIETDEQRFMRLAKPGATIRGQTFVFRTPFVISGVHHLTIDQCDITCVRPKGDQSMVLVTFDGTCDYLTIQNSILRAV